MFKRIFTVSYTSFVLLFVAPVVALACGGFFTADDPINQTRERIIFTINDDDTISTIVDIAYQGEADDFSWILPVPATPQIDVVETETLDLLEQATTPTFDDSGLTANPCLGALMNIGGMGGGGGITQGTVGPYEFAVIENTRSDEMFAWLADNGYVVNDAAVPVLESYAEAGMAFVAMRLQKVAVVGDIQPVKLTFKADQPMIPIRLAGVTTEFTLPIIVWIFADTQYAPENYARAELGYGQMSAPFTYNTLPHRFQYSDVRRDMQTTYDGQAFATEFAGPTTTFAESFAEDDVLSQLAADHPYMTRLYAQLDPAQMTLDPVFAPAPDLPDMSSTVDLSQHTDALNYWNCTTERFYDEDEIINELPNALTVPHEFAGNLHLRYPATWDTRPFTLESGQEVYIVAPEFVTPEDVVGYFNGEPVPPMLIVMDTDRFGGSPQEQLYTAFNAPFGSDRFPRLIERPLPFFDGVDNKVVFVLAPDEDVNLLQRIENHVQGLAYYAHPQMRHTLFFGGVDAFTGMYFGYPDGWTAALNADGFPLLTAPDNPDVRFSAIHALNYLPPEVGFSWFDQTDALLNIWQDEYGLSDEQIAQMAADIETESIGCRPVTSPQTVTRDGETVTLMFRAGYLLVGQAPTNVYDAYAGTFAQMQVSINVLCG